METIQEHKTRQYLYNKYRKEAKESAEFRGHKLRNFIKTSRGGYSFCVVCGREVSICTNPLPNEINVGGEAVALGCKE